MLMYGTEEGCEGWAQPALRRRTRGPRRRPGRRGLRDPRLLVQPAGGFSRRCGALEAPSPEQPLPLRSGRPLQALPRRELKRGGPAQPRQTSNPRPAYRQTSTHARNRLQRQEYVYNHHLGVPYRPLVPDAAKSVGEPNLAGNLIVHGDNLHALKSLLPRYAGQVDLIFIDPPLQHRQRRLVLQRQRQLAHHARVALHQPVDGDDMLRHDKWLCMMWRASRCCASCSASAARSGSRSMTTKCTGGT